MNLGVSKLSKPALFGHGRGYHPFQNHYTHEIITFELIRGLQLQLLGLSELLSNAVTVSLFFLQNGVTGKNSPQEFSRVFGN